AATHVNYTFSLHDALPISFGEVMPGDIKYKDVNGDGIIDDTDVTAIGATTRPNLIYGFGVSANWKGIDINVHFQGAGKSSYFIRSEEHTSELQSRENLVCR